MRFYTDNKRRIRVIRPYKSKSSVRRSSGSSFTPDEGKYIKELLHISRVPNQFTAQEFEMIYHRCIVGDLVIKIERNSRPRNLGNVTPEKYYFCIMYDDKPPVYVDMDTDEEAYAFAKMFEEISQYADTVRSNGGDAEGYPHYSVAVVDLARTTPIQPDSDKIKDLINLMQYSHLNLELIRKGYTQEVGDQNRSDYAYMNTDGKGKFWITRKDDQQTIFNNYQQALEYVDYMRDLYNSPRMDEWVPTAPPPERIYQQSSENVDSASLENTEDHRNDNNQSNQPPRRRMRRGITDFGDMNNY